jgi:hypothetical protein
MRQQNVQQHCLAAVTPPAHQCHACIVQLINEADEAPGLVSVGKAHGWHTCTVSTAPQQQQTQQQQQQQQQPNIGKRHEGRPEVGYNNRTCNVRLAHLRTQHTA